MKLYRALNWIPPLGRGISWTLELDSWLELDWSYWESYEKLRGAIDNQEQGKALEEEEK